MSDDSPTIDEFWQTKPALIRQFLEQLPDYEQLCAEIEYTLGKLLDKHGIEVASITSRAKKVTSFLEKLQRKTYKDPFSEITDFAGARVVCLYVEDLPAIERVIRDSFRVIEMEDKRRSHGLDRFGYNAIHFIVKLGLRSSGPRYDHLKDKPCEIQVRTVLQDAWAVFSHHLLYKHESDIPDELKREINAIAAMLEAGDMLYQLVRNKRDQYIAKIGVASDGNRLDGIPINRDSLIEYLKKKFPGKSPDGARLLDVVLWKLPKAKYSTLLDVDRLLSRTEKARQLISNRDSEGDLEYTSSGSAQLARALVLTEPEFRENFHFQDANHAAIFGDAVKLVEPTEGRRSRKKD